MSAVDATAYLVVKGMRSRYGDKSVNKAKVLRATQGKPPSLTADEVAVKVTVRMPVAAFDPLEPVAVVVVPEELIQHPVEVEATD